MLFQHGQEIRRAGAPKVTTRGDAEIETRSGAGTTTEDDQPPAIVHTGSISSSVDLDYVHGEAHKVYHPSLPVRLLYWVTFQAPFPYVANHDALEAARQRRIIVDLLTKYWFGHHLVARVLDIADTPAGHDFVTRLVRGREPPRDRQAWQFLKEIDKRFLDAGLPTWQVTRFNPHAITNFVQARDGSYRIIDLESSLVAFLYPLSAVLRLVRAGLYPSFDDIDVARLRAYLAREGDAVQTKLGDEAPQLLRAVDAYERAATAWHAAEPRLFNRGLRFLLRLVDLPARLRR
jgi:hypothetical protein